MIRSNLFIYTLLLALSTFVATAYAAPECYVNNLNGNHFDFSSNSGSVETGKPFGTVKVKKYPKGYYAFYTVDGIETFVKIKGSLSITKQEVGGNGLSNLVCQ